VIKLKNKEMKVHELMAELSKLDSNEDVHFDNGCGGVPVTNVGLVPMNKPRKKGSIRYFPWGIGLKRCKTKSVLLYNKNTTSENLDKIK